MKKLLAMFVFAALAVPSVSSAQAQGWANLAGYDCGSSGYASIVNSCSSNTRNMTLVGSVVNNVDISDVIGMVATIRIDTDGASLPSWWQVQPGGCRAGALTSSFDFRSGFGNCLDPWVGMASGTADVSLSGATEIKVTISCQLPAGQTALLDFAPSEYYMFVISIDGHNTLPSTICPGCNTPTCIFLDDIRVVRVPGAPGGDLVLPPVQGTVLYNSGSPPDYPYPPCESATPTRKSTWGSIKSLYR